MTPRAATIRKTFSRCTSVRIDIAADAAVVWRLLTRAADYPNWNSTVISIDGDIAQGQKIVLKSRLAPTRAFTLTVKECREPERLVWGDRMGTRTYSLGSNGDGTVTFSMEETIGGTLFPFFARMIPSFDQSFDQFAADLKKAAEATRQRAGGVS